MDHMFDHYQRNHPYKHIYNFIGDQCMFAAQKHGKALLLVEKNFDPIQFNVLLL